MLRQGLVEKHESVVLRDNDLEHYHGMTVYRAVQMVNEVIGPAIIGMEVTDQRAIDTCMIETAWTDNKKILGGNSIYSVSLACLRAAHTDLRSASLCLYKWSDTEKASNSYIQCH